MSDITYPTKNTGDQFTAAEANEIKTAVNTKVDKVGGKGLSTNDFDATAKGKVDNLPADTNAALSVKSELIKATSVGGFPLTGDVNFIYLNTISGISYHWDGTTYKEIIGAKIFVNGYAEYN